MSLNLFDPAEMLWKPLFEAAAQTFVGAIGAYSFGRVLSRIYESNRYDGQLLKIDVLDHVIMGVSGRSSLRELGYFY